MTKTIKHLFLLTVTLSIISCKDEPKDNNQYVRSDTTEKSTAIVTKAEAKNDSIAFHRVLSFNNLTFDVKAIGKGSLQRLTIQPSGLSEDNRAVTVECEPVVGAEVGDLNADNNPELLIFTQSAGSGSYGKVIAYSVNNGKSMSNATFPDVSKIDRINKGYMGHDKFTIINNKLTQVFPVYSEDDVNSKPTGKDRIITYILKNGEAPPIFVVDQVLEVPHQKE